MDFSVESHLENFSLRDFFLQKKASLDERLDQFSASMNILEERGFSVYRRTIKSAMGARVIVSDWLTKQDKEMIMFGSNNYLGLANHPDVKSGVKNIIDEFGIGAGGPPLLNGTTEHHNILESKLAKFKKLGGTVLFSSGFSAQLGWMTALIEKNDNVFFDEFSHASFFEGLKLTGCKKIPFRHNDMIDLEKKLKIFAQHQKNTWICCEGVYSMDGDIADLPTIVKLAEKYKCKIALDDAHGTGVLGQTGSGTSEYYGIDPGKIDVHLGTFSKSFGTVGGFICAEKRIVDYMRYMAKAHMFSGALPIPVVYSVIVGLDVLSKDLGRIQSIHDNTQYLIKGLKAIGIQTSSNSAIIPIIVPEVANIRDMACEYHRQGIFLNSVEYPAVPMKKQRFRISVMSEHNRGDLDKLIAVTDNIFKKFN